MDTTMTGSDWTSSHSSILAITSASCAKTLLVVCRQTGLRNVTQRHYDLHMDKRAIVLAHKNLKEFSPQAIKACRKSSTRSLIACFVSTSLCKSPSTALFLTRRIGNRICADSQFGSSFLIQIGEEMVFPVLTACRAKLRESLPKY